MRCDVCDCELAEPMAVFGFCGSGSVLCRDCYEYADELMSYHPEEEEG